MVVYEKRLKNDIDAIYSVLKPVASSLESRVAPLACHG